MTPSHARVDGLRPCATTRGRRAGRASHRTGGVEARSVVRSDGATGRAARGPGPDSPRDRHARNPRGDRGRAGLVRQGAGPGRARRTRIRPRAPALRAPARPCCPAGDRGGRAFCRGGEHLLDACGSPSRSSRPEVPPSTGRGPHSLLPRDFPRGPSGLGTHAPGPERSSGQIPAGRHSASNISAWPTRAPSDGDGGPGSPSRPGAAGATPSPVEPMLRIIATTWSPTGI